ncbi:hypothetical protein [Paraburkholderia diazotrophica]|uniref:hypothetical protein n=1 Tax=Paraburkholderia diazotrophica TaxID=667676 RepID=UPI00316D5F88
MKVFDRYLDREVALPEIVESGRYRLLGRAMLNGEHALTTGDLLLSDGRERCMLDGETRQFSGRARHGDEESAAALVRRAVQVLARRYRAHVSEPPSPLIPSDLAESVKLNELDDELARVFSHGHLDEIARKPRFAMKYEAEVTQIHRVRRMAPRAVERLAAHSEDWYRRTFFGVLPGRLLAMLSDDDWSIYENKVYARLLDRLNDYLSRRLVEVRKLHDAYAEAERLKDGGDLYFKLSHRLYELWGAAMDTSATARGLKESGAAIEFLESAKRRIGMLRQGQLYGNVPRAAHVPAQLRNTNILMHDPHYRHLPTLWREHQRCSIDKDASARDILADNREALTDFAWYLRMLLQRVMASMKLADVSFESDAMSFSFAGTPGRFTFANEEIRIRQRDRELVIVPALTEGACAAGQKPDGSGRIVIACLPALPGANAQTSSHPGSGNIINPFDFYGEERLRRMVERFLWSPLFHAYGREISRLPGDVLGWLGARAYGVVRAGNWRLATPLAEHDRQALRDWLKLAQLNDESRQRIAQAAAALDALGKCRHCGRLAEFTPRERDFEARCNDCDTRWGIYSLGGRRVARMRPDVEQDASFANMGSWFDEFELLADEDVSASKAQRACTAERHAMAYFRK